MRRPALRAVDLWGSKECSIDRRLKARARRASLFRATPYPAAGPANRVNLESKLARRADLHVLDHNHPCTYGAPTCLRAWALMKNMSSWAPRRTDGGISSQFTLVSTPLQLVLLQRRTRMQWKLPGFGNPRRLARDADPRPTWLPPSRLYSQGILCHSTPPQRAHQQQHTRAPS